MGNKGQFITPLICSLFVQEDNLLQNNSTLGLSVGLTNHPVSQVSNDRKVDLHNCQTCIFEITFPHARR